MARCRNIGSLKLVQKCVLDSATRNRVIVELCRLMGGEPTADLRWVIKTYYHYSPRLVEKLKNQKTVNIIIRKALNQFIKLIK